jgi:hypothetical protein
LTRPRTTAGKRNVQQNKLEKARAKQLRRAARRQADPEVSAPTVEASESELLAELAEIHGDVETGAVSPQDFEQRRERIREQLEQIERLG